MFATFGSIPSPSSEAIELGPLTDEHQSELVRDGTTDWRLPCR